MLLTSRYLKDNDGIVITNGKEMADALNIYFSSVFTLEDKNNLPVHEPLLADNVECLTNMLITPAMIVTKIKKLKDNKSPGIDGITPKLPIWNNSIGNFSNLFESDNGPENIFFKIKK